MVNLFSGVGGVVRWSAPGLTWTLPVDWSCPRISGTLWWWWVAGSWRWRLSSLGLGRFRFHLWCGPGTKFYGFLWALTFFIEGQSSIWKFPKNLPHDVVMGGLVSSMNEVWSSMWQMAPSTSARISDTVRWKSSLALQVPKGNLFMPNLSKGSQKSWGV